MAASEADLYGTVIERERLAGRKAAGPAASPVASLLCGEPARLVIDAGSQRIMAECADCPPGLHPVSTGRVQELLGTEVSLTRAWKLREQAR